MANTPYFLNACAKVFLAPFKRLSLAALLCFASAQQAVAQIRLQFTNDVLVEDVVPMGMHLSGDTFFDSVILKERVRENFEGAISRVLTNIWFDGQDESNVVTTDAIFHSSTSWLYGNWGTKFTVLNGPDQWVTGRVENVERTSHNGKYYLTLTLDRSIRKNSGANTGLMLDRRDDHPAWVDFAELDGNSTVFSNSSGNVSVVSGDTPDNFGNNALRFVGDAFYQFWLQSAGTTDTNGRFEVRFFAKALSGTPELKIVPEDTKGRAHLGNLSRTRQPGSEWEELVFVFDIDHSPQPGELTFLIKNAGGTVLIDDLVITELGHSNPTAFRDEFIHMLEDLRPGVIRVLVNMTDRVGNRLGRAVESYAQRVTHGIERIDFGMHEAMELAKHLDSAIWYTLPGSMTPEEVEQFVEYIAAPADVGWGAKRAALGHPEPWTDSLDHIFVQFGNEHATFPGTGYPAPGYWESLMATGKASPYHRDNIVYVVDGQGGIGFNTRNTPSSDAVNKAGYMAFSMHDFMLDDFTATPADLADYVLSIPYDVILGDGPGSTELEVARDSNKEIVVYEGGNFHTTFGSTDNVDTIRDILSSHVGGVAAVNEMLLFLKHFGVRYQNSFNLAQVNFSASGGAFGNLGVPVPLWGAVIDARPESLRYRPRMLAMVAVNKVLDGHLVDMEIGGPSGGAFRAMDAIYSSHFGSRNSGYSSTFDLPRLESYGLVDGNTRGLILINQDTREPIDVTVDDGFAAGGATAEYWRVAPPDLFADNENTGTAPQVGLETGTLFDFGADHVVTLQPGELLTLRWTRPQGAFPEQPAYRPAGDIVSYYLEAEAPTKHMPGQSNSKGMNWRIFDEPDASAGQYVLVPNVDYARNERTSLDAPQLDYEIYSNSDAPITLWLRVNTPSYGDDSVKILFNGEFLQEWFLEPSLGWEWRRFDILLQPGQGFNTLSISMREDGTAVDQIFLTEDPNVEPGDPGIASLLPGRILQPPTYSDWIANHPIPGEPQPPADGDLDGDGRPNWFDAALLDVQLEDADEFFEFEFRRPVGGLSGVRYSILGSADLSEGWAPVETLPSFESFRLSPGENAWEEIVRVKLSDEADQSFIRAVLVDEGVEGTGY